MQTLDPIPPLVAPTEKHHFRCAVCSGDWLLELAGNPATAEGPPKVKRTQFLSNHRTIFFCPWCGAGLLFSLPEEF
jgi:hypothetical protein